MVFQFSGCSNRDNGGVEIALCHAYSPTLVAEYPTRSPDRQKNHKYLPEVPKTDMG